jgi:hypothetical protein
MESKLNYRELLVKEPFYEVMPYGRFDRPLYRMGQIISYPEDKPMLRIITQADFMREYFPSGHKIMDHVLFPDIYKKDVETGKWYIQPVTRSAFAFQHVIALKQTLHLIGNDVQFELSGHTENENEELAQQKLFISFRQGWLDMDMETRLYEAVNSIKITGDGAVIFYFDKEQNPHTKVLSFLNGDTLYPHINSLSGKMEIFARKYKDYDDDGNAVTEWVEVWDEKFFYRAKRGIAKNNNFQRIKEIFGLGGFTIVSQESHGFNECPVAYYRDPYGACWRWSQNSIENYEESFSYLCEDNKAHAFPIMYYKGDGIVFNPDTQTGAVKSIEIPDSDSEVGYLDKPEVSESFNAELSKLYDMIYEQSFCVKPPELKSGDLPGVAIKLLFSPAIENATCDAQKMSSFLHTLVHLVQFSYGLKIELQASLLKLPINAWIEPYVHQNDTELITNLSTAVQNKFLSTETASERIPKYARNDETSRLIREDLRKRKLDLQSELDKERVQIQGEIEKQVATSKLQKGQDINTGKSGRPNTSGRSYDVNGNWEGRDNWDDWNKTH